MKIFIFFIFIWSSAFATNFGIIKKGDVNVRKGPGKEYQVVFKFKRPGLPVQILHKIDEWYLVKDFENETGWIISAAISFNKKNGIIIQDNTSVCRIPTSGTEKCNVIAIIKQDVIVKTDFCSKRWCRVILNQTMTGWIEKSKIWGV